MRMNNLFATVKITTYYDTKYKNIYVYLDLIKNFFLTVLSQSSILKNKKPYETLLGWVSGPIIYF